MKNKIKILQITLIFSIFILFALIKFNSDKDYEHEILEIKKPDTFYIDINDNKKIDENELFKIKDIYALTAEYNDFTRKQASKNNINIDDYLKTGYIVEFWAQNFFKNKKVRLENIENSTTDKYRYATIYLNNRDIAQIYLQNGLAVVKDNAKNSNYYVYQNINQIKKNAKALSQLDFALINLKSGIYHNLNCDYAHLINNGKLILKKYALKSYIPCKSCIKNKKTKSKENFFFQTHKYPKTYSKFDNIEIYLIDPNLYSKPNTKCTNDACKRLIKEINNAKKSIDIAIFGFGEVPEIFSALKNAKQRGVKIKAVADFSNNSDKIYPNTKDFIKEFAATVDSPKSFMHNKFFIFDNKLVMTGSANISSSGIYGYNSNIVLFINSPEIALIYEQEFNQMHKGNFSTNKKKHSIRQNPNLKIYFSAQDDIQNAILDEIKNAKEEILVSAFYLTDRKIINELINKSKLGLRVLVLMDATSANSFKDRVYNLRNSGIPTIVENWGGKNHEKTMLIDKNILIAGSCNFSRNGFQKNDENVLIIKNKDIAHFYRNYYFYLFNSIDKKFLKFIPRAEGLESKNSCFDGLDNNYDGKIDSEDVGCQTN